MSIPNSSDWSLACINNGRRRRRRAHNHKPTSNSALQFLSLPSSNIRFLITNSSICPSTSTILEDHQPPNCQSMIEFKSKFQDSLHFKIPSSSSSSSSTQNLNGSICTLFKDPKTEQLAYDYYEKTKQNHPEFKPQKSTLKHLIRYLLRSKNWSSLLSLSEDFRNFQLLPDCSTCIRLVSSCIRARKFKIVSTLLQVFECDKEIAILTFDSAMKGYNKLHMYSSTITVYERMRSAGIVLDPRCYCQIMEAYMKIGDTQSVLLLFQEFETNNKTILLDHSTQYYTEIYRILCESLGKSGRASEALEYFRKMQKKGIQEIHSIYSSLICSFAIIRQVNVAEELFNEAESKKMLRDPAVFLKLILMYVEEGLMEKTLEIVSAMERVRIRVSDCIFCAIVNGFSKKRGLKFAVEVYDDMILRGCEPGQVTYASIINVYCRLGLYFKAERAFSEMEKRGFDKCVVAYSSMVAMYGKTGRLRDAMRLVAKMKERGCEPNVWIYNSLLDMHGRELNLRQVEKIWKEMKRRKILADKVSYTSVISAYSKAREFETCIEYYYEFRMNGGGVIDRAMGGIMVGVFSKMSRIDELVKLLQDMKSEGTGLDMRLYRSALNALRDAGLQIQAKWLKESFGARLKTDGDVSM